MIQLLSLQVRCLVKNSYFKIFQFYQTKYIDSKARWIILFVNPLHAMNPRVGADKELWKLWGFIHFWPVSAAPPVLPPFDRKLTMTAFDGNYSTCRWAVCWVFPIPGTFSPGPAHGGGASKAHQLSSRKQRNCSICDTMFTGCSCANQRQTLKLSIDLPAILSRLSFWSCSQFLHCSYSPWWSHCSASESTMGHPPDLHYPTHPAGSTGNGTRERSRLFTNS